MRLASFKKYIISFSILSAAFYASAALVDTDGNAVTNGTALGDIDMAVSTVGDLSEHISTGAVAKAKVYTDAAVAAAVDTTKTWATNIFVSGYSDWVCTPDTYNGEKIRVWMVTHEGGSTELWIQVSGIGGYKQLPSSDATNLVFVAMTDWEGEVDVVATRFRVPTMADIPVNLEASPGGSDDSLVTTGDKYTWNNKADLTDFIPEWEPWLSYKVGEIVAYSNVFYVCSADIDISATPPAQDARHWEASNLSYALSFKANKDEQAVQDNLAAFNSYGNPVDSGIAKTDVARVSGLSAVSAAATNYTDSAINDVKAWTTNTIVVGYTEWTYSGDVVANHSYSINQSEDGGNYVFSLYDITSSSLIGNVTTNVLNPTVLVYPYNSGSITASRNEIRRNANGLAMYSDVKQVEDKIDTMDTSYFRYNCITNQNQSVQYVYADASTTELQIQMPDSGMTKDWLVYILSETNVTIRLPAATYWVASDSVTNAIPSYTPTALYFTQVTDDTFSMGRKEFVPVTVESARSAAMIKARQKAKSRGLGLSTFNRSTRATPAKTSK